MARAMTLDLQHGHRPTCQPLTEDPSDKRHVTLILDGIQSSGKRPGSSLRRFLLGFGDVIIVRYPHESAFNNRQFASDLMEVAQLYEEATLLGLSLGGLLAHDTAARRLGTDTTTKLNLILADTPPGKKWLQQRRGAEFLARFQGFDVPCEPLLQTLMFKQPSLRPLRFVPKPAPYVGKLTEEQREELDEHVRLCAEYPLAPWFAQLAYLVHWPEPQSRVLQGVTGVFMESEHDDHVRSGAYDPWNKAYQETHTTNLPVFRVNSPHVGLMERPTEWEAALRLAFSNLGVQPLA